MRLLISFLLLQYFYLSAAGQDEGRPQITCIPAQDPVRLDGWLNEADWDRADSIIIAAMVARDAELENEDNIK